MKLNLTLIQKRPKKEKKKTKCGFGAFPSTGLEGTNVDTTSVVLSEVGSYAATLRMAVVNSVEVEVLSNKQNQSFAKCQQTSKKKNETNPVAWAINETRNVELVTLVSEQKQLLEKGQKKTKEAEKLFCKCIFIFF